ncbi:MAG: DUF309 domain-containing protein [Pirellulales bacterium]
MIGSASRPPPPARLLPLRQLPPYSYVSGRFPHPNRDPRGHSYAEPAPQVGKVRPEEWRQCETYLWGIDLFNYGYYWESHEAWEAVWHASGRRGTVADFCKLLIKFAAAGVKAREGRPEGVKRHALRAKQLLDSIAAQVGSGQQQFMGLSLPDLAKYAERLIANPAGIINTSNERVVIVMPFALEVSRV